MPYTKGVTSTIPIRPVQTQNYRKCLVYTFITTIVIAGETQGPLYDEVTNTIPDKGKFDLKVNCAYGEVKQF